MQVNLMTNLHQGMSNRVTSQKSQQVKQTPVQDSGLTASIYFGSKKDDTKLKNFRNGTLAIVAPLIMAAPMASALQSCDKDETWAKAESFSESYSDTSDTTIIEVNTHAKGCTCPTCCGGKDTVYKYITDTINNTITVPVYIHDTITNTDTIHHTDTITVPGETVHDTITIEKEIPVVVYVDTGSYHVVHDTIEKWKDNYQKPIPLDTLGKLGDKFGIDGMQSGRKNIVSYQGVREWEYGDRFVTMMNQLQSNRYTLVYDREDFDWEGNHTGYGKDVFRYPRTNFKIKTYGGKVLNSPKGIFVETYKNPFDSKNSDIADNELVTRQFFQTVGDSVNIFTYDKETGMYREDGRVSKGYLGENTILLTDLIASDPDKKFRRDPEYSTEDHLVACKVVTVNDEELKLLYVRAKDDEVAEGLYGTAASNARMANPWEQK